MILADSSPGYFEQPAGGDLTYIGDTSIVAPSLTDSFACTDCGVDTTGGDTANGSSSDGLWSSIGAVLGGIFGGYTATAGPVTVSAGTPQYRPAPTPAQSQTAGIPSWLWLVLVAIIVILLLRK